VTSEPLPYTGATGVSTVFGTFGELLQGALPEPDGDFLVTMPIARWSTATFVGDRATTTLTVRPAYKRKALALLSMIMESAARPMGGLLTLDSSLPEGKGFASSSADLVAAARAVGNALGIAMPPARIEAYLRRIEPTDGVLYDAVVAYHHRSVRLREVLGTLPALTIVGVDEGGQVDTVAFNRIPKPFSMAQRWEYARLLDRLTAAVRVGDLAAVGAVATRSAELNQALWRKSTLDRMVAASRAVGGLGVVAAHSGTALGILLDNADAGYADRLAAAVNACDSLGCAVSVYRSLTFDAGRPAASAVGAVGSGTGWRCGTTV
jgi:uncharacterized protein involved in propanediol utilization